MKPVHANISVPMKPVTLSEFIAVRRERIKTLRSTPANAAQANEANLLEQFCDELEAFQRVLRQAPESDVDVLPLLNEIYASYSPISGWSFGNFIGNKLLSTIETLEAKRLQEVTP